VIIINHRHWIKALVDGETGTIAAWRKAEQELLRAATANLHSVERYTILATKEGARPADKRRHRKWAKEAEQHALDCFYVAGVYRSTWEQVSFWFKRYDPEYDARPPWRCSGCRKRQWVRGMCPRCVTESKHLENKEHTSL